MKEALGTLTFMFLHTQKRIKVLKSFIYMALKIFEWMTSSREIVQNEERLKTKG